MSANQSNSKTPQAPVVNKQVCSCFDVYTDEICEQIQQGVLTVDEISDLTYACQGCGGCRPKIEALISEHLKLQTN